MAERVNRNVDWVVDDDGNVTGFQVRPGDKRPIGGAAATAGSLVTPPNVVAGDFPTPLLTGSDNPPLSFFNKKKSLGIFAAAAVAVTSLTGGATKKDETADAFTGNTQGSAYPANNGVSTTVNLGSGGAVTAIPSATSLAAQSLANCNVYIRFKVVAGGAIGPGAVGIGLRLYTGTTVSATNANYLGTPVVTNWNPTLEWQTLGFALEDFAAVGTAVLGDLAAITHAGVRIGGVGTATDIVLGDIFFCPKQLTKGAIVIAFDDCRADTWTQAKFELDKRGYVGTLFPGAIATVLRAGTDQYQMSTAQLQKMNAQGTQVAGQAWETESPVYTQDTAMSAMAQLRGFFRRLGTWGNRIGSYFSNYGPHQTEAKAAFKANFPWGMRGFNIGSDGGITAKAVLPEVFPIADPNYIRALGVDLNANSLSALQTFTANVIAGKGIGIFVFHGIDSTNGTQFAKFTGWLDYLVANEASLEVNSLERFVLLGHASPM